MKLQNRELQSIKGFKITAESLICCSDPPTVIVDWLTYCHGEDHAAIGLVYDKRNIGARKPVTNESSLAGNPRPGTHSEEKVSLNPQSAAKIIRQ